MNLFVKVVYGIRITYISCPLEFYVNSDVASCVFEKMEPDYYIFRNYKDDIITLMNYEDNSIKEEHRRRKYF